MKTRKDLRVVVTDPLPLDSLSALHEIAEVVAFERSPRGAELEEAVRDADALITRSNTNVTRELLAAAPRLRVVGRAGVGIDNIDLEAATERGIVVINVAGGNSVAVAEHVFGLLLGLCRHILAADRSVREGRWERSRFVGDELRGKTIGIVGLGRVGGEVAVRASAFGMRVIAYDPYIPLSRFQSLGAERIGTLEDLLAAADIVTLHTPLTDETRGMIDREALRRMKRGAYLINAARGSIVDEAALVEALESGHLAGAAIDVFAQEPPGDHPFYRLPNVVLTPHLGGSTREALDYNTRTIAEQVAQALRGQPVRGAVNLPQISDEDWWAVEPLVPVAELLGLLYRQGIGGPLEALEFQFRARRLPSPRAVELLSGACLKGMLAGVVEGPVNMVNAALVAERQGIELRQSSETDPAATVPVLEVRGGRGPRRSVAGSLTPEGLPRLVNLDGLPIDMVPSSTLLLTRHQDRPGMIGRVGTILGRLGINIAAMQVARRQVRGEAIMVLALDDPVSDEAVAELRRAEGMDEIRVVTLPPYAPPRAQAAAAWVESAAAGDRGPAGAGQAPTGGVRAAREGEEAR
ncbi:MAG TPA: phosphoglycerate dehydrogenase [Bacillota bacterium]